MKDVIHDAKDHTSPTIGKHDFKKCPVAEKSDLDAAENRSKGHADWLAGELRKEIVRVEAKATGHADWRAKQLADTKANLATVQALESRVEQLRSQMESFIDAISGKPIEGPGVGKAVEQFEQKIDLAQRKNLNKLREDLEMLETRLKGVEKLPASFGPAAPPQPPPPTQTQEMEIGQRKVELNLRDCVERISNLEQKAASRDQAEMSRGQVESLTGDTDSRTFDSTSFWRRLRWLVLGPPAIRSYSKPK